MNSRSLLLAAALAGSLSPVFASSTSTFDPVTQIAYFSGQAPLFVGGVDTVTFTGLAAGNYDYSLSISAQYIDGLTADLNGTPVALNSVGHFTFGGQDDAGDTPFILTLHGDPEIGAAYSGQLGITSDNGPASNAPEPESIALMLAGLGFTALKLRQRKAD